MSTADEVNLERGNNHDDVECGQGMRRLRDERDSARRWAVEFENETRALSDRLDEARRVNIGLIAYMQAHNLQPPNRIEDIDGVPA